jgi:hypothetical protein
MMEGGESPRRPVHERRARGRPRQHRRLGQPPAATACEPGARPLRQGAGPRCANIEYLEGPKTDRRLHRVGEADRRGPDHPERDTMLRRQGRFFHETCGASNHARRSRRYASEARRAPAHPTSLGRVFGEDGLKDAEGAVGSKAPTR